jgi:hypothetical protein
MNLHQLIRELHWLEWQMRAFEDKYGVLSRDFFQAMEAGQLSEFDDGEEPHFPDFLEWHALYKMWQERERAYRDALRQQSVPEQLRRSLVAA